jgi:hypothetical protein
MDERFPIPPDEWEAIERAIADDTSPVGIDPRKTHVIIIHKLTDLQRRLERLERRVLGETGRARAGS